VSCGHQHTLFLSANGKKVYSTGRGEYGVLGHGDTRDENLLVAIDYFAGNSDVCHKNISNLANSQIRIRKSLQIHIITTYT